MKPIKQESIDHTILDKLTLSIIQYFQLLEAAFLKLILIYDLFLSICLEYWNF